MEVSIEALSRINIGLAVAILSVQPIVQSLLDMAALETHTVLAVSFTFSSYARASCSNLIISVSEGWGWKATSDASFGEGGRREGKGGERGEGRS